MNSYMLYRHYLALRLYLLVNSVSDLYCSHSAVSSHAYSSLCLCGLLLLSWGRQCARSLYRNKSDRLNTVMKSVFGRVKLSRAFYRVTEWSESSSNFTIIAAPLIFTFLIFSPGHEFPFDPLRPPNFFSFSDHSTAFYSKSPEFKDYANSAINFVREHSPKQNTISQFSRAKQRTGDGSSPNNGHSLPTPPRPTWRTKKHPTWKW